MKLIKFDSRSPLGTGITVSLLFGGKKVKLVSMASDRVQSTLCG